MGPGYRADAGALPPTGAGPSRATHGASQEPVHRSFRLVRGRSAASGRLAGGGRGPLGAAWRCPLASLALFGLPARPWAARRRVAAASQGAVLRGCTKAAPWGRATGRMLGRSPGWGRTVPRSAWGFAGGVRSFTWPRPRALRGDRAPGGAAASQGAVLRRCTTAAPWGRATGRMLGCSPGRNRAVPRSAERELRTTMQSLVSPRPGALRGERAAGGTRPSAARRRVAAA